MSALAVYALEVPAGDVIVEAAEEFTGAGVSLKSYILVGAVFRAVSVAFLVHLLCSHVNCPWFAHTAPTVSHHNGCN